MLPLFLMAAVFSVLAPLFWTHVEMPAAATGAAAYEDREVYGRILPAIHYGYGRLGAGEWPLWAPGQYCGVPYFANPVHGLLQPLNAVFHVVPPIPGLALHAFLGLFLMALFFSLFLRALGTAYVPAAIGGMVYAFCGATATAMSRPELLGVLAWSPLLYWVTYEYTRAPKWPLVFAGGVVNALLLFAGSPALAAAMAAGALLYGAVRIAVCGAGAGAGRWRSLRGLLLMGALGLFYAAVQWVPSAVWLAGLANPGEGFWPGAWTGQLPGTLREVPAALLAPDKSRVTGMLYFGAIPLMLIPAALLHRTRRFEVLYFLAAALGWLGLAVWGSAGVPGADAWKILVFPGAVAVAVLAGLGADRLLLAGRDPRSPLIWGSVVLALAAAALLLIAGTAATRGAVALAVIVLLPFFILRVRWLGVICGICVAFLLFIDLRGASVNLYQHPHAGDQDWLRDSLPAIKEAEAQALGERILALPSTRETVLPANIGLMQPVDCAGGGYWPLTAAQEAWWSALSPYLVVSGGPDMDGGDSPYSPELLNVMAARVVVGEHRAGWMDGASGNARLRLRFLQTLGRLSLWKNETALNRIRWVPGWQPVNGVEAAMAALLDSEFSAKTTCVVEADGRAYEALVSALPPGVPEAPEDALEAARAVLVRESAEELEISVESAQAGILVVADSYDTGWRALVDGRAAPILRVNGLFRGVYVPAGAHNVVLAYAPISITAGLLLTGVGLVGSAVWLLLRLVRGLRGALARDRGNAPASAPVVNLKETDG